MASKLGNIIVVYSTLLPLLFSWNKLVPLAPCALRLCALESVQQRMHLPPCELGSSGTGSFASCELGPLDSCWVP